MLDDRKLRKNFRVVHFDHALRFILEFYIDSPGMKHTLLILPHPDLTPEMSKRIGLCSQKGPVLTSLMKPTAEKYMLCNLSRSTTFFLAISPGFGEPERKPSTGIESPSDIAGQYCEDPNM